MGTPTSPSQPNLAGFESAQSAAGLGFGGVPLQTSELESQYPDSDQSALGNPFDDAEFRQAYEDLFGDQAIPPSTALPFRQSPERPTESNLGKGGRESVDGFYSTNKIYVRTRRKKLSVVENREQRNMVGKEDQTRPATGELRQQRASRQDSPPPYVPPAPANSGAGVLASAERRHMAAREQALRDGWKELRDRELQLERERSTVEKDSKRLKQDREDVRRQRLALQEEQQMFSIEKHTFRHQAPFVYGVRRDFTPRSFTESDDTDFDRDDGGRSSFDSDRYFPWTTFDVGCQSNIPGLLQDDSHDLTPPRTPADPKVAFDTYTTLWQNLKKDDPDIPFPISSRVAEDLLDCSHPTLVNGGAHSWSDDAIVKFNACRFFLDALGISTACDPVKEKILVDFKPVPTAMLSNMVSKLRVQLRRWHSDSLQHRNGGQEGLNLELANDPKARAVFVGFSELRDEVQAEMRDREKEPILEDTSSKIFL
ncbi:hypothetical protein K490DRAFT_64486 [Saccharata proteae CBS 121410]|uniref:Uncharacterized protein n=1 Tax=Saccharata proteae CBS 121410 TaxID=1314787 RepID=A0A9P4HXS9_9PEZI|nr:hypothetical protein K490DRAFT_64486 [Saccharata proteae CBS 121410]